MNLNPLLPDVLFLSFACLEQRLKRQVFLPTFVCPSQAKNRVRIWQIASSCGVALVICSEEVPGEQGCNGSDLVASPRRISEA